MASKVFQVRIDEQLYGEAEEILQSLGLNMSEAVRLYLNRVVLENGLPFPMVRKTEAAEITSSEPNSKKSEFDSVQFLKDFVSDEDSVK